MTRDDGALPLFRPEAVEFHARGEQVGRPLLLGERTTRAVFVLLLVGLAAAFLAAWAVPVDEWARGRAVVAGDGAVDVVLPAASQDRLRAGLPVVLDVAGREVTAELDGPGAVTAAAAAGQRTGVTLAGAAVEAVVVARARLPAGTSLPPGATGDAEVRLARGSLLQLLVPGLGGDR